MNDPEQLHSPFVDMNEQILGLVIKGKVEDAATQMDLYLNLSERTVLKALERAGK